MKRTRVLTGITPSGTPHLGNYLGAIRPAILASKQPDVDSFYFLADFHAQIKCCGKPERIHRATLEIAATWLAVGLDPQQVTFYRQSDIPEIPQLNWILTCVTSKGLLNRAHAYKAMVDKNNEAGDDPDAGVSAGLYMYPVLMAADILMFKSQLVPVGRDQIQHVEMARDIAERFNYLYGQGTMVLPEARIDESVATLPGLDGRKMSKSYNNTLPLFSAPQEMKRLINNFVTDMKAPGEAKDTEGSALFEIYKAFATEEETQAMCQAYADGIAWGEVKRMLFERVEQEIGPMRERYEQLMANPAQIEDILLAGSEKARKIATPFLAELRQAVGLRSLRTPTVASKEEEVDVQELIAKPSALFKQYRESDGLFYFKLAMDNRKGDLLMQSQGFTSGREAGQRVALFKKDPQAAFAQFRTDVVLSEGVSEQQVVDLLQEMMTAQEEKNS